MPSHPRAALVAAAVLSSVAITGCSSDQDPDDALTDALRGLGDEPTVVDASLSGSPAPPDPDGGFAALMANPLRAVADYASVRVATGGEVEQFSLLVDDEPAVDVRGEVADVDEAVSQAEELGGDPDPDAVAALEDTSVTDRFLAYFDANALRPIVGPFIDRDTLVVAAEDAEAPDVVQTLASAEWVEVTDSAWVFLAAAETDTGVDFDEATAVEAALQSAVDAARPWGAEPPEDPLDVSAAAAAVEAELEAQGRSLLEDHMEVADLEDADSPYADDDARALGVHVPLDEVLRSASEIAEVTADGLDDAQEEDDPSVDMLVDELRTLADTAETAAEDLDSDTALRATVWVDDGDLTAAQVELAENVDAIAAAFGEDSSAGDVFGDLALDVGVSHGETPTMPEASASTTAADLAEALMQEARWMGVEGENTYDRAVSAIEELTEPAGQEFPEPLPPPDEPPIDEPPPVEEPPVGGDGHVDLDAVDAEAEMIVTMVVAEAQQLPADQADQYLEDTIDEYANSTADGPPEAVAHHDAVRDLVVEELLRVRDEGLPAH